MNWLITSKSLLILRNGLRHFVPNDTFSWFYLMHWNLNQILNISGVFESKNLPDHILKIAGSGLCFDYCFLKNIAEIKLPMLNAANFFKVKDDFKVINQFIPAYLKCHCIYYIYGNGDRWIAGIMALVNFDASIKQLC